MVDLDGGLTGIEAFGEEAIQVVARHPPIPIRQLRGGQPALVGTTSIEASELLSSFLKKRNIKPELETYHTGGNWVLHYLIDEGLIEKPYWVQTVMGYQTSSWPTVDNVLHLLRELPEGSLWLCSGIGPYQLPLTTLAAMLGGHLRVGLEDNVYFRRGEKAKSNAQLVERAARIVRELNRDVATPAQARELLGLSATPSTYA